MIVFYIVTLLCQSTINIWASPGSLLEMQNPGPALNLGEAVF